LTLGRPCANQGEAGQSSETKNPLRRADKVSVAKYRFDEIFPPGPGHNGAQLRTKGTMCLLAKSGWKSSYRNDINKTPKRGVHCIRTKCEMAFTAVRHRAMQQQDVAECARLIASHPILRSRYGDAIRHLGPAWLRLLGSDAFVPCIFEDVQGSKPKLLGAGISVFVTDEFVAELKTPPFFWIGRELASRVARGKSPLLSGKELRAANSSDGLNVAVWQTGVLPEHLRDGQIGNPIMAAFVEMHRGFRLKEIVTQGESVEHVGALRVSGGLLWKPGGFVGIPEAAPEELVGKPHVIGVSRDLAVADTGSWIASMFLYKPPRFGFSPSKQRLILSALGGATDKELAGRLRVSLATVKKTWRAIYECVDLCVPGLLPGSAPGEGSVPERGKEKKQRLLAYFRQYPEELRPFSRKLLQQSIPSRRSGSLIRSNIGAGG